MFDRKSTRRSLSGEGIWFVSVHESRTLDLLSSINFRRVDIVCGSCCADESPASSAGKKTRLGDATLNTLLDGVGLFQSDQIGESLLRYAGRASYGDVVDLREF